MNLDDSNFILDFLNKDITLESFEQWVYSNTRLETILSDEDYLELISLDFTIVPIYHDIQTLLRPYINYGEVHRCEIMSTLEFISNQSGVLLEHLGLLSRHAEMGYWFLADHIVIGNFNDMIRSCCVVLSGLSESQQYQFILKESPDFLNWVSCVLQKMANGDIQLTGDYTVGEYGQLSFTYIEA